VSFHRPAGSDRAGRLRQLMSAALRPLYWPYATTDALVRIRRVHVGIVDVGANTVRLLVASAQDGRIVSSREARAQVGLGEEIESSGHISETKLEEAARVAVAQVRRARQCGSAAIQVVVTSPGRQAANGDELVDRLERATGVPTVVLTPEEEGALGWRGAVSASGDVPDPVAVCDVGGGSAQITVGQAASGPSWVRSIDVGSLRLAKRAFEHDPPDARDLATARETIAIAFRDITPPLPRSGIAVGGTARALRKVVGEELSEAALLSAVDQFANTSTKKLAKQFGIEQTRARTMTAGALILLEVQRRLNVSLRVGRGGIREGAALALLAEVAAARRSA
jgi:exopolyphosphatase/guanosine-5'-triphosphate,3'-diphosphate pyrophosphatase